MDKSLKQAVLDAERLGAQYKGVLQLLSAARKVVDLQDECQRLEHAVVSAKDSLAELEQSIVVARKASEDLGEQVTAKRMELEQVSRDTHDLRTKARQDHQVQCKLLQEKFHAEQEAKAEQVAAIQQEHEETLRNLEAVEDAWNKRIDEAEKQFEDLRAKLS